MMGSEVSPLKEKIKQKICTLHQKLPAILFLQRFDLTEIFNSHLSNLTNLISAKSFTSVLRFAFSLIFGPAPAEVFFVDVHPVCLQ